MLTSRPLRSGGLSVGKARKLGLAPFYAAMALMGAVYAIFEHHQANWLGHSIKEVMPAFLILILVSVVHALLRTVVSVLETLNGVSLAADATLHADYGKK
jgi:hypothetical protein